MADIQKVEVCCKKCDSTSLTCKYNVFEQADLGIHRGAFVTHRPIPAHGVMWLHMKYSPQYPSTSLYGHSEL